MATKQNDENHKNADPQLDSSTSGLGNPPPIQKQPNMNYQKEKTKINSLETFTELVENDIFKPDNYKRIKNNISHVAYSIKDHILLYLIALVILKRLIANLKEVLFNN